MLAGEQLRAIEVGEECLAMAEALGLEQLQASVLITVGTARGNSGDIERGIAQVQNGLDLAVRLKEPQHVQRGYNNLAQLEAKSADYGRVTELYQAARRFIEEYGLPGGLRWVTAQEAVIALVTGDWETAERLSDEFLEAVDAGAPHYMETQVRAVRAQLRYARGDVGGALDEVRRSVEIGRRAHDPQVIGSALAAHATLLLAEAHADEAATLTDEVIGLRNAQGGFAYFTWIVPLAWLAHDLDRAESFREVAENEPRTPWVDAGYAILDESFVDAAELLNGMGLTMHEAYARLRAAEQLASKGRTAEAAEQRDRALAFYRSVGASTYVRRAEALLPASA
jgi:tetratricopeptide (TPR) repeat protein